MFLVDDAQVVCSASDLAAAARCEFALLRTFDVLLRRVASVETPVDAMLARTRALGDAHEQRVLDRLRERLDGAVTVIGRPAYTAAGLGAAAAATLRAVAGGAPALHRAVVFDGTFVGFADFLVRDGAGRYRVTDTKLARSATVAALLQVAAYADTFAAAGIAVAPTVELVLGDGSVSHHDLDAVVPVYRQRRAALHALLDAHRATDGPVDWDTTTARRCLRCETCGPEVRRRDDLLLVAGMRVDQRARLHDAGITTVAALAECDGAAPGLAARVGGALVAQARLQVAARDGGPLPWEVCDSRPLRVLPEPDRGDLFFDFEGDPLWTADGEQWGLEYLWGVLTATGEFTPLWAHDRAGERQALIDFLALVRRRRRRHPGMHVYHYASYEKTALLRLAGRYGVGEEEVDDLLRHGVLVDLFPLVRTSIRVGAESYGLKALEPLYMRAEPRAGDVTTATSSITGYADHCAHRDAGRAAEAAATLAAIEDYNHDDCRSTRGLRDWLLVRAIECGTPPRGPAPVTPPAGPTPPDAIEGRLLAFAGDGVAPRDASQQAVAMIAAACGFHRREDKPFWWAHFDRLDSPVEEWTEQGDVFVVEHAEVLDDWHPTPRGRLWRRTRLHGTLAAGGLGHRAFALYHPPSPAALTDDPDRRAAHQVDIEESDDVEAPTTVVVRESIRADRPPWSATPFALAPPRPVDTGILRASLAATAEQIAAGLPTLPADAVTDLLLRHVPRTRSGRPLPRSGAPATDITAALLDLDRSYIGVHGPPGTGKTHTAAAVITRLVTEHGWRVGVVAQSHAAVENLLGAVLAAGVDAARVGKSRRDGASARDVGWTEPADLADFVAAADTGCVLGGTAWTFANPKKVPRGALDLLVVEEAGQFSLAATVAVAPSADNLLLLGDPQQLPQVTVGRHPEPVDTSALGWLASDGVGGSAVHHHTLPTARGYFLDRSWRMHPAVCGPVSRLAYDGRLRAHAAVSAARHLDGVAPGVSTHLVAHTGNTQSSAEEAAAVVGLVAGLLGRRWTDEDGSRPLAAADVLVVTPYNAQVRTIREHLDAAESAGVRVGTVDRFQGQEAAVVLVSMTASSAADVPRGLDFLLHRQRLNVALSRARYAAVVVRSPTLTEYLPADPAGLQRLGTFLAVTGGDVVPAG